MKIDTNTLLIGIVAIGGIYLLTRPKTATPVYSAPAINPYLTSQPNYAGNQTAQDISAGATALTALGNTISNFF
jgi:hypothetical protein